MIRDREGGGRVGVLLGELFFFGVVLQGAIMCFGGMITTPDEDGIIGGPWWVQSSISVAGGDWVVGIGDMGRDIYVMFPCSPSLQTMDSWDPCCLTTYSEVAVV